MIRQVKSKDRNDQRRNFVRGSFTIKNKFCGVTMDRGNCKNVTYFYYICRENEFECDDALAPV